MSFEETDILRGFSYFGCIYKLSFGVLYFFFQCRRVNRYKYSIGHVLKRFLEFIIIRWYNKSFATILCVIILIYSLGLFNSSMILLSQF